jgi:hypothetical protein
MLIDFDVTFCGLLDEEPRYLLCVTYQIAHLPISYLPIDLGYYFVGGIPWRAKLFSCVTYQIAYLLISYLSIQEVTKRWVYVNWFVGNILVFLVGGGGG